MLAIRPGFYGEVAAPTDGITPEDSFAIASEPSDTVSMPAHLENLRTSGTAHLCFAQKSGRPKKSMPTIGESPRGTLIQTHPLGRLLTLSGTNNEWVVANAYGNVPLSHLHQGSSHDSLKDYIGLGTLNGLGGELVIAGAAFLVKPSGEVTRIDDLETTKTPFAMATYFPPDLVLSLPKARLEKWSGKTMREILDDLDRHHLLASRAYAIRIELTAEEFKSRSVGSGTMDDRLKALEEESVAQNQDFTLVGFRLPDTVETPLNVPGYHFHALPTEGKTGGGHVLDFKAARVQSFEFREMESVDVIQGENWIAEGTFIFEGDAFKLSPPETLPPDFEGALSILYWTAYEGNKHSLATLARLAVRHNQALSHLMILHENNGTSGARETLMILPLKKRGLVDNDTFRVRDLVVLLRMGHPEAKEALLEVDAHRLADRVRNDPQDRRHHAYDLKILIENGHREAIRELLGLYAEGHEAALRTVGDEAGFAKLAAQLHDTSEPANPAHRGLTFDAETERLLEEFRDD